ncbi:MAG: formimidoylglutamate deiminase [Gammaproteobacteria bacterium]|nr:formimidoylglutamate deiminase [Gammaproteobacteria bacterium]
MPTLRFQHVLTPSGFGPAAIDIDDKGRIAAVEPIDSGPWDGWLALPGMVNAHSHSFQRVLRGFVERAGGERSFWGWREQMYRVACHLTPEQQYAIAHSAFCEMLAAGYTSVGEFHYIHRLVDGSESTAMADAVVAAAADTGIRLALLPVFYSQGGFGVAALPEQQRFIYDRAQTFLDYVARLQKVTGIAPHSLRAVTQTELQQLVGESVDLLGDNRVVHIHIAEQQAEVRQCLQQNGKRPLAYLLESCEVDDKWSLVHATHTDQSEWQATITAGATVVLCPLTEANLGDGLFAATEFTDAGGRLAIGSDCNARIDAIEELRLLEYGQRLRLQARPCLYSDDLGATLWANACANGARAVGLETGTIAPGQHADLVVLEADTIIGDAAPARVMDAWLTGGDAASITAVYTGGVRRAASSDGNALRRVLGELGLA